MAGAIAPAVRVDGARELRRTAKAAGVDMSEFKEASERAGAIVQWSAVSRAPIVSGDLAASIRPSRGTSKVWVYAGNAGVPYAGPIHWGWPARNIKANMFIRDAMVATEPQWVKAYEDELNKIIEKVKGA